MTIYTYYFTYGYLVSTSDALRLLGYTEDKITDELKEQVYEYTGDREEDPQKFLWDWFVSDQQMLKGRHVYKCVVTIGGTEYTLRSFSHDEERSQYFVIGVNVGKIGRFDGWYKMRKEEDSDNETQLLSISKDEDWCYIIQNCKGNVCHSNFGLIRDSSYSSYIRPQLYISTDDCDCCS